MMGRDPLRFTAPHRLGCECHACQRLRHASPAGGPRRPLTPEDGRSVSTPEDGQTVTTRED